MKTSAKTVFLGFILFFTWAVTVYHRTVVLPTVAPGAEVHPHAVWLPKARAGINQLVIQGGAFGMGWAEGEKTKDLIYRQESELIHLLKNFFPNPLGRRAFELLALRWFWGEDKYLEPWMLQEMDGVSRWTSDEFNYLGNPLTRQIAYHGVHEVGQMAVDQGSDSMGCTVVAVPQGDGKSWIIGRNFDFEGGRVFDSEKVVKWIFPEKSFGFVSVSWAGMIGVLTGVNERGVYVSLNAAGSRDFARYGTPSTLVIRKALTEASSAREALEIIKKAQMFITDIFVVGDRNTGELFRVEKSPRATEVIQLKEAGAVTNHLVSPRWLDDGINKFRTFELTSLDRSTRAEKLLKQARADEASVLAILRDKGEGPGGRPLDLGNRAAIDSLIATHSVIYNEKKNVLYVGKGPGVSGEFIGYDLAKSFAKRSPVEAGRLPADPVVTPELFTEIRKNRKEAEVAQTLIRKDKCEEAKVLIDDVSKGFRAFAGYFAAEGDYEDKCKKDKKDADVQWLHALDLSPPYPREKRDLKRKLGAS